MILGKYTINGEFIDLNKGDLDLQGNLPYVLAPSIEALADGYTAVEKFDLWTEGCKILNKDFIFLRDQLKANMLPLWESLSGDELKKLISLFIYTPQTTQEDIDAFFTSGEQLVNWRMLVLLNREARSERWKAAAQTLSFYLTQAQTLDLYNTTVDYSLAYIDASDPHLTLWFTNGAYAPLGIDFTSSGFAQKAYYSDSVRDVFLNIIVSGSY